MNDPLYQLPAVTVAPDGFEPSVAQHGYARLLVRPGGPETDKARAEYLGVPEAEVAGWLEDPRFRAWLAYQTEADSLPLCMAVWREVYRIAVDSPDPARRLEAARMFLGRFDPGCRTAGRDVRRAVGDFAKVLAREAVRHAGPRTIHATVLHGTP